MDTRDYRDAMLAGVISAIALSIIGAFVGSVGFGRGPEAAWAALLGFGPEPTGWWLGFVVHIAFGALVAIGYLWIFEMLYRFFDHWFIGALVGMLHCAVLGFLLGLSPKVCPILFNCPVGTGFNPSMPDMVAWIGMHAIFGILMWMMLEEVEGRRRIHRYLPPGFVRHGFD